MKNQLFRSANGYLVSYRNRGFGLMTVIFALGILSIFTLAVLTTTNQTMHAVTNGEKVDRARYAAYSGIQSALERLNRQAPGWSHYVQVPGQVAPPTNPTADDEDLMQVGFRTSSDVQAIVGVYNNSNFCPLAYRSATAPDGTVIPPGKIYISATAFVSGNKKLETASIGVLTTASGITFDKALFSDGQLAVNDAYIDSFSSDNTAVAGAVVNSLPPARTEHCGLDIPVFSLSVLIGQHPE